MVKPLLKCLNKKYCVEIKFVPLAIELTHKFYRLVFCFEDINRFITNMLAVKIIASIFFIINRCIDRSVPVAVKRRHAYP